MRRTASTVASSRQTFAERHDSALHAALRDGWSFPGARETIAFRDMPDGYLPDWFDSLDRVMALDWERMIPGHPYVGRLGTREDVRNLIQYTNDLSAAVKVAADQGKCFDQAMTEIKLPKYEKWGSYAEYLPGNIERFCEYWGRGY